MASWVVGAKDMGAVFILSTAATGPASRVEVPAASCGRGFLLFRMLPMVFSAPKASKASRGYDAKHVAARKRLLPSAYYTPCIRCGHTMLPTEKLHLDHIADRSGYLGFSHGSPCHVCGKRCNLPAGAAKGARITNARRKGKSRGGSVPVVESPPEVYVSRYTSRW